MTVPVRLIPMTYGQTRIMSIPFNELPENVRAALIQYEDLAQAHFGHEFRPSIMGRNSGTPYLLLRGGINNPKNNAMLSKIALVKPSKRNGISMNVRLHF